MLSSFKCPEYSKSSPAEFTVTICPALSGIGVANNADGGADHSRAVPFVLRTLPLFPNCDGIVNPPPYNAHSAIVACRLP